ncbi:glycosyltransferase [Homoserinibacter sp. YIM 151385]|uniref:glycosyltransferase n=1 Tax=Homoserinibacter sp. YIM 151385 TaxID=2985506 RepID=UPI0022F02672|nr:glycosyltransferase [Homoserinibacter sp. YIM 151385]WBU38833.1 glycosyltransferase [Homoserinibacter sp. YIM 151385]
MTEPLVVVSAGTYHLPFTRLIEWVERWTAAHPEARVVVQHGPTRPVAGAENHEILPYSALLELCRAADAVVLQGGAGGIMDLRALGRRPIVVPRVPVDDEVVDDHQLRFAEVADSLGLIHMALAEEELHAALDGVLGGTLPSAVSAEVEVPGIGTVAAMLASPPSALPRRERGRRLRRSVRGILADRRGR